LGGADDHRNSELRGVLSPLKALAERHDVAIVLVSHLNKGGGTNAKYRVTGSIAYVGACRANFLCVKDPDDPARRRRLPLSPGANRGPDPPTLAYQGQDDGLGPVVAWEPDPVDIRVEDALRPADPGAEDERAERAAAADWLRAMLGQGPVPYKEIER